MPPKVKKVDPEKLKRQFEEYQQSDEYRQWQKLLSMKKEYDDISETSHDITGKWQIFHDELYKWGMIFKVKTKQKSIQHEHVRSFFFARWDKEIQFYDGQSNSTLNKDQADRAWSLRRFYIELWRGLDEINDLDENNFTAARKSRQKCFTDFFKYITTHIKTGHKEIYEQIQKVIEPLVNLMESTQRLVSFECQYKTVKAREIVVFKETILLKQFCQDLQRCLKVLSEDKQNPLKITPDMTRVVKKLYYKDWQQNPIEAFYLKPLELQFTKLKWRLSYLFMTGIDFWKLPLSINEKFYEDVQNLIQAELIADNLMRDQINKEQLNFVYQTLKLIMQSPAQEKLTKREDSIIKITIPNLIIFKTIKRMRSILDRKKQDQEDKEKFEKQNKQYTGGITGISEEPKKISSNLMPSKNRESIRLVEETLSEEEQKYGRYLIWGEFIDASMLNILDNAVEKIRHLNEAVQQDIEDNFITEGLIPRFDTLNELKQNKETQKEARKFIQRLKEEDNKLDSVNSIRPPNLWNSPEISLTEHKYRSIAAPNECYIDGRIQQFEELIQQLANHIVNHRKEHWKELINRVIDCYVNDYKPQFTLYENQADSK